MNKKDRYSFPAVFNYADDGISISFPDLPGCFSCAQTTAEAFSCAREAMGCHLVGMEDDNEIIPQPSDIKNLQLNPGDVPAMIETYMPAIRARTQKQFVKKTLSIPAWLNAEAEESGINFSQLLQDALKSQLHDDSGNRA